jgi:hypothetical protein
MARKRTTKRVTQGEVDAKASYAHDGKPAIIAFTLEQALAELDRLTPWSRSLPICKALLQNEIGRLRAEGDGDAVGAKKYAAQSRAEVQLPPTQKAVCSENVFEVGSEPPSKAEQKETASSKPTTSASTEARDGVAEPGEQSSDALVSSPTQACMKEQERRTTPDHWDSEDDLGPNSSAYLDGSVDYPEEVALPEKSQLKIRIPVEDYPGYNFVGRLLGPRGATLKHLELSSKCRLYIRGRGSLRFTAHLL